MWRIRYALQVLKDDRGIGVVEVILILVDICTWYRYVYTIFELHN